MSVVASSNVRTNRVVNPRAPKPTLLNYQSVPTVEPELHSVKSLAAATILGGVLAGAVLMAINFKRLGRRDRVVPTIVAGVVGLAVVIGLALALPVGAPSAIFMMVQFFAIKLIATKTQGDAIAAHEKRGGKIAKHGKTVGIGAIVAAAILAVVVPAVLLAA
jgi:hypothetical protein